MENKHWKYWKVGDKVICTSRIPHGVEVGKIYKITNYKHYDGTIKLIICFDEKTNNGYYIDSHTSEYFSYFNSKPKRNLPSWF